MDGRSSGGEGAPPQLVECPAHLGEGDGDRPGGLTCLVDGELPLDPPCRGQLPSERKPMVDLDRVRMSDPTTVRALIVDGNYGGRYQRADDEMKAIWRVAVAETRELLEGTWQ